MFVPFDHLGVNATEAGCMLRNDIGDRKVAIEVQLHRCPNRPVLHNMQETVDIAAMDMVEKNR
jgi:hypothetical protein